ncbi:MAG: metallophosphoesterase [Clostridia bacterium]|nr:metallophosphoesterase [Clostridia bacterium]
MSVYAIADLHLSFGVNKPMDIFFGWDNYVQKLEKNWKKLVSKEDTVIIPGDISWGINYAEALPDLKWMDAMPGKKILLKGNHDLWWDTMGKNTRLKAENELNTIEFLFNNSFAVENIAVCGTRSWFFDAEKSADKKVLLREVGRLQRSIDDAKESGKEPVVFLHYPPLSLIEECEEIIECLVQNGIKRCYYGHMHGKAAIAAFNGEKYGIRFKLISADTLGFVPYLIEK